MHLIRSQCTKMERGQGYGFYLRDDYYPLDTPETGWIVFDPEGAPSIPKDALRFAGGLALTASVDMLHAMAEGLVPARALLTLGYSGWSPGQLEDEMREGSWIPIDLDPALIFELPIEDRWRVALESLGIDPGRVTSRIVPQA